jgi:hypothetical protein
MVGAIGFEIVCESLRARRSINGDAANDKINWDAR